MARLTILLICLVCASDTLAQGVRVESRVSQLDVETGDNAELQSSSVTLLTNGKAYDFVEAADEVIIFQPAVQRYTILNTARELVTNVTFQEVGHLLGARRSESAKLIDQLTKNGRPEAERVARSILFQLDPKFDTDFDPTTKQLTLHSPLWKYTVTTHEWEDEAQVEQYLNYADRIAELNYVLQPRSFFPEPRLELNRELRELGRLPTSLKLDLRPDEPLLLQADYKFVMQLNEADQNLIRVWDAAVASDSLRELPFRAYQEATLANQR